MSSSVRRGGFARITSAPARVTSAFTLIELLVVIAIIAVLAAILFPVFARARAKARQSACSSNLKQIGLSLMQYVQDYDGTYPYAPFVLSGSWNHGEGPSLAYLLQPYQKSAQLWRCPDDAINTGEVNTWTGPSYPGYKNVSYAYNLWGFSSMVFTEASLKSPAEVCPVWGARGGNSWLFDHPDEGPGSPAERIEGTPEPDAPANAAEGHTRGGNFLYADGHVKWIVRGRIREALDSARAARTSFFREF